MEFYRVNKHMIRCKMNEKEINRMGFTSEALYDDSDEVVSFYNTIYEKACEEGYDVGDNYLAVKTLFVSNDKILLSFSDREFNNPYDQTIEKYLGILDVLERVGKQQLIDMLDMDEKDKKIAFTELNTNILMAQNNIIRTRLDNHTKTRTLNHITSAFEELDFKDYIETVSQECEYYFDEEDPDEEVKDKLEPRENERVHNGEQIEDNIPSHRFNAGEPIFGIRKKKEDVYYLLYFSQFSRVEMFSKMIDYKLKSSLYKEKDQYILSVCMKQIPEDIKERVLGYGSEFAMKIHNDDKRAAYYSEFLEVIIRENAIEVLNNL